MLKKSRRSLPNIAVVCLCGWLLALALFSAGCKRGSLRSNEIAYVAVPQAVLRDRLAALYNKVGTVTNGQKVEILERQKRFVKVRTAGNQEGWIEQRYLAGQDVFDGFAKLAKENGTTPAQAKGATRAELNMHLIPTRDAEKLYQLAEGEKVDILKRATAEKQTPGAPKGFSVSNQSKPEPRKPGSKPAVNGKGASATPPATVRDANPPQVVNASVPQAAPADGKPAEAKPMDDWWLVRDKQGRVGWVLARMIDIDVPMEVAQYAEGQRIQACFVLNRLRDQDKDVPQYLVLMTEPKDGLPFDFNSFRVFTWSLRRHRYETAYRERNIMGFLPASVGTQNFDKEGTQPIFTLKLQNEGGEASAHTYRLAGTLVRRVLAPGEETQKLAQIHREHKKKAAAPGHHRHSP
ncbi:MAG: SH3 domain-containing protein [Candidatus Korobacteraceae bacterium]